MIHKSFVKFKNIFENKGEDDFKNETYQSIKRKFFAKNNKIIRRYLQKITREIISI